MTTVKMTKFQFDTPQIPQTDIELQEWVDLLNRAPAGYGNEWRKSVLSALMEQIKDSKNG